MSFVHRASQLRRSGGSAPLSDADVRALAPSVFATGAHASRSERYAYIPTSDVLAGMRAGGFVPVFAGQARPRDAGRAGHAKHMLRFRHVGAEGDAPRPAAAAAARRVGDVFPEIALVNSHDGSSAYRVMSGVFRLVCLNGMIVADRPGAEVRVRHAGDVVREVVEGSFEVLGEARRAVEAADAWAGAALSRDERLALSEGARLLRFGGPGGEAPDTPITAEHLLAPRRAADAGRHDLWTVFNVVQENALRGGLQAWDRRGAGDDGARPARPRRVTTRPVNGIDGDVRLNRALWALAERMAELKGVAAPAAAAAAAPDPAAA